MRGRDGSLEQLVDIPGDWQIRKEVIAFDLARGDTAPVEPVDPDAKEEALFRSPLALLELPVLGMLAAA